MRVQNSARSAGFGFLVCLFLFLLAGATVTQAQQTPELFTPLPENRLRSLAPVENKRVDQIKARPTTQSVTLMQVDATALKGERTRMALAPSKDVDFSRSKVETRSEGDFTWYGVLADVPGQATLVVHDGNITGSIRDGADLYRVEPVGGGVHAVIKVDQSRFPPDHPPSFEEKERRGDIQAPEQPDTQGRDARDLPISGINVLVAYTIAARNAVADIEGLIRLAVDEANQSYVNSGVRINLRLVDTFENAYSESGKSFETILADFKANQTVNARRAVAGADLAAQVIDQSDFCGLADAIMANASSAFALVYYDCATGYFSFAHELGHLMGARHDPKNDPTTTPFAYGHGYQHPSTNASQAFRTIMAYRCDAPENCEPRIQWWSNPNVSYAGFPTGTTATNDNARVLNGTAATVASFKWQLQGWFDTDRPGGDYKNFDLAQADPGACQRSCASETKCRAWTYVKPGVQGASARCWLKQTTPAMTSNACCVSGVKNIEYDVDRLGSDYKNFDLAQPDPALCQSSCNAETQCKSWTFVRVGFQGAKARCWLKNAVAAARPSACCASGFKDAEFGVDRLGSDFKSFDLAAPDPFLCNTSCRNEGQCKAWTYVRPGIQGAKARCWLKNSAPAAIANDCCTSGIKGAEYATDRPGLDYKSFDLSAVDPGVCKSSCDGEAQCKAWTYVVPGVQGANARCWLKTAAPVAQPNACCVSGVK